MTYQVSGGLSYPSFRKMAEDLHLYPGRLYEYYCSNRFMKELKEYSPELVSAVVELKRANYIPDIYTFKVSYLLNPYMSLRYHRFIFNDYESLGKQMLAFGPVVDVYLKDLLIYHLLSSYMEVNREDKRFPKVYEAVKKAEQEARVNENMAYWSLAFKLAGTKTLTYRGRKFDKPEEFFKSCLVISDLFPFASTFLDDCCVLAWLKELGHENRISHFISLAQVADQVEDKASKELAKALYSQFGVSS